MLDYAAGYEIQINPLQVRRSLPSSLQHPAPASRIEAVVQYDKQGPLRRVIEQAAHVAFNSFRGMVAIDKNKLRRHIRAIQLREQRGQDSLEVSRAKWGSLRRPRMPSICFSAESEPVKLCSRRISRKAST